MKWYYNMKIGNRLISAFLVIAVLAGIIGVIGIVNIKNIDKRDTVLYETMTVPLGELVKITESYERMRVNLKDILLSTAEAEIIDYEKRIKERNEEFNSILQSFEKTLFTDEGKLLTKEIFEYKSQYDAIVSEVIQLIKANNREQAFVLINGDGEKLRNMLEASIQKMNEMKINEAQKASEENANKTDFAIFISAIILIICMITAIFLAIFISSSIKKPINKLVDVSKKMADGDLDITIDINTNDELGELAKEFKIMAGKNNELLTNILYASEQVTSGSNQVSDSSIALSQGTTEQASAIEELTSSLEEVASQTKLNAENANQANTLADNTKGNAIQGNKQMDEMLMAMESINESSSNISKVIKVIDEIAFQTNILALNAAVEAARAGQYGKGFAVVAEEVRNLAARSANAAKETTVMIESSIKKAENGTKIAEETATALNEIVYGIEKVAAIVGNIAVASNEQATAIEQINQGIMQVSQVVQENSATSEESSAASEELSGQALQLNEMVSKFNLKESNKTNDIIINMPKMIDGLPEREKDSLVDSVNSNEELSLSDSGILREKEFSKY